jgi:hypothetical protein
MVVTAGSNKVRAALFSLTLAALAVNSPAWGCNQVVATAVASQVTSDFATLVHFTKAACAATTDGARCSVVCISDLNIVGDNRNLALTMITASAGKRMRDAGLSKFSSIAFANCCWQGRR